MDKHSSPSAISPPSPVKIRDLLLVALLLFWSLAPLAWMLITSLKEPGTEMSIPVRYWPEELSWENYAEVLGERFSLGTAIRSSLVVSSASMLLTLVLASLAAFAIARLRMKHRVAGLLALQLGGMVPPISVVAPTFVIMRSLGLLQTHWAMIIPNAVYGIPLAVLLLSAYFRSIPVELDDAARMDGAGPLRILWSVVLPIARPGLVSAAILVFMGSWSEFMLANAVSLGRMEVQTLPVRILSLSRAFSLQWSWVAAAVVISVIPVIILSAVFQKYIVQGLSSGSLD